MDTENIVQMPTLLERLASKLKTCLKQEAHNRQEWIAIQEAKCATLVEIRDQFKDDDNGFGAWCLDSGFGKDVLNNDTRAACIAMGRDPAALHACLEASKRRSLETIFRLEFDGFRNVPKPSGRRTKNNILRPTYRMNTAPAAEAAAKNILDDGKTYGEEIAKTGLSNTVLRSAVAREEGRREVLAEQAAPQPLPAEQMPHTMRERYEAALRKARRELREEITAEVCAAYQDMVTWNRERVARADRILDNFKGLISRQNFRKIKACLHPDHNSFQFAAEALQIFSELEDRLVKPEPKPINAPSLPQTMAELLAMRDTVSAQRRAARAQQNSGR